MTTYWRSERVLVGFLAFVLLFCLLGCTRMQEQEERNQALREEPEISLYIVASKETKNIPVEEYILGVVAGEMKPEWPEAAYAAQAILARSFTAHWLETGKQSRYGTDLSTDVEEAQAYDPTAISDVIRQAVKKTRGQVMIYEGEFVKGWFHSYSGGKTATVKEGLDYEGESPPYVQSVNLPDNPYVPDTIKNWEVQFSASEVKEALGQLGVNIGEIESVSISKKGPSGRATRLQFRGSAGTKEVSAPEFRIAIDPVALKSTLLTEFRMEDGTLIAKGTGFGHGVGLSQWDAYMLAKEGMSATDIVHRFFQGVEIKKAW